MKFEGTERFRLVRQIGSGSFGSVYEAEDLSEQRHVALKLLRDPDPESLVRFKQEFRSLANLRHRNVTALYELLSDGSNWFYTMELVHGAELLEYLARQEIVRAIESGLWIQERGRSLTEPYLRDVRVALLQLADALAAIHEAGKLHRDVKPSNILVTDDGRVVLLDFGLVRELTHFDGDETSTVAGTPGYMAPEQANGGQISEASDWYAFGVVLYQALTGTLPFTGSFFDISHKQKKPPRRASELVKGIPRELDDLCASLLGIKREARAGLKEVRACLAGEEMTYWLPPFRLRRLGHDRAFVGRSGYLDLLRMFHRDATAGNAKAVFMHGSSGVGKTALVNAFLDQVRRDSDAFILATRCYERELLPYRALDGIVDSIVRLFTKFDIPAAGFTPQEVITACSAFPILKQLEKFRNAVPPNATIPATNLTVTLAQFFRKALTLLAAVRPTLLFIDDAQWGDLNSGQLLNSMFSKDPPPVTLVLGYTSEDFATSLLLQTFRPEQGDHRYLVHLEPFDADEARELIVSSFGKAAVTETLVQSILREASGNAFFIEELVSYARDQEITDGELSLSAVLQKRFDSLSDRARALLGVVAAAGSPVSADWVRETLQVDRFSGEEFSMLRSRRWIRSRFTGEREEVEIYHSRLREVVLARRV